MEKVKVIWGVDDHYVGKSRPQYTYIDKSEFIDCETKEDFMAVIEDAVQSDFEALGYSIDNIDWGEIELPE